MFKNAEQAEGEFRRLDGEINKGCVGAPACINDDIINGAAEVDRQLREWQEGRWPMRAAWELF